MTISQNIIIFVLASLCIIVISFGIMMSNDFMGYDTPTNTRVPTTKSELPITDSNNYIVGIWKDDWILHVQLLLKVSMGHMK